MKLVYDHFPSSDTLISLNQIPCHQCSFAFIRHVKQETEELCTFHLELGQVSTGGNGRTFCQMNLLKILFFKFNLCCTCLGSNVLLVLTYLKNNPLFWGVFGGPSLEDY